jgi:transposase
MIVVGVDVHKHSLTAVAVDQLGRVVGERSGPVDGTVISRACSLDEERLWAVEDCRHVTRGLEQALTAADERLVRVPPRLTAPQRRRGRARGKSDAIDALAVARAALQEPLLDGPRAGEETLRELKLLVDHRDDLVAERRRCQQRLRWHLHELDPALTVPLGALDRTLWLDRLARQLARREQTTQVRIARDLLGRSRTLTRSILELDRELQTRTLTLAPRLLELAGCGPLSAAKLLCEIGPIDRFPSDAQLAGTLASHHWMPAPANTNATASTAAATANSTARCTGSRSPKAASTHPHAPTWNANNKKAKHAAKQSAASNANSSGTVYTTLKNEPLLT